LNDVEIVQFKEISGAEPQFCSSIHFSDISKNFVALPDSDYEESAIKTGNEKVIA
jgi:hypothetical protein